MVFLLTKYSEKCYLLSISSDNTKIIKEAHDTAFSQNNQIQTGLPSKPSVFRLYVNRLLTLQKAASCILKEIVPKKWSSSNKIHEISFSVIQNVFTLKKRKFSQGKKIWSIYRATIEQVHFDWSIIDVISMWYLEGTLKISDPFQICTWEFPINCQQIPKTLWSNSLYFFIYWGLISLTQTEENSTD